MNAVKPSRWAGDASQSSLSRSQAGRGGSLGAHPRFLSAVLAFLGVRLPLPDGLWRLRPLILQLAISRNLCAGELSRVGYISQMTRDALHELAPSLCSE